MKQVTYSYKVLSIDDGTKTMQVKYSAEGRDDVLISARLPYQNESIEAVIEQFSPVFMWEESDVVRNAPSIGMTGTKTVEITGLGDTVSDSSTDAEKLEYKKGMMKNELTITRRNVIAAGFIMTNEGHKFSTSFQTLSNISSTIDVMRSENIQTVNWKTQYGAFINVDDVDLEKAKADIVVFIQKIFDWEKSVSDAIDACATIDSLSAIDVYTVTQ